MKVLVVGGAGYIGAITARVLTQARHDVTVLDDLSRGHREAVDGPLVVADIADRRVVKEVLSQGFDGVMHFAAWSLVGQSVKEPLAYYDNNVAGTIRLLQAMLDAGVHNLVFSSTCAIYGNPDTLPLTEDHPKNPISPYGASKNMVERIIAETRETTPLRATTLRYFNAAGAWPDGTLGEVHDPETHLIPLALHAGLGKRPPLKIFGTDYPTHDGTCIRDYIHVLDLADAHLRALKQLAEGSNGSAYNLGTGIGSTVREVIDAAGEALGHPIPHAEAARRPGDPPALFADNQRVYQALGWQPTHSLEDCVRSALAFERARPY